MKAVRNSRERAGGLRRALSLLAALSMAVLAAAAYTPPVTAEALSSDDSNFIGNIVEDNFFFINSNMQDQEGNPNNSIAGWDMDTAGGTMKCTVTDGLEIIDQSATKAIQMQRRFKQQKGDTIVMELCFRMMNKMDGLSFQLLNGEIPVIRLGTSGSQFGYVDGEGNFYELMKYRNNTKYGLKAVIDLAAGRYDLYLNGQPIKAGIPFFKKTDTVDSFMLRTSVRDEGSIFFGPLKIYKGYLAREILDAVPDGSIPAGWTYSKEGGSVKTVVNTGTSDKDYYSFLLNSENDGGVYLATDFAGGKKATQIDFMMMADEVFPGTAAKVMNGGAPVFTLLVDDDGYLCYRDGAAAPKRLTLTNASGTTEEMKFQKKLWYTIRLILDPAAKKADLYVNYKKVLSKAAFSGASLSGLRLETAPSNGASCWYDNIYVQHTQPLPADYVPAPVKPQKKGGARVGMQYFPGWKVGTHISWIHSYRRPELNTVLGKYDMGSTEVADWETKYMAEHGVDFMFIDWYQSYGKSTTAPQQVPLYNYGLEGYFYSQYSDSLNFAIQVFGPFYTPEDYINNIIPYWVNYYFSDPRYEVIDNKPVLGIGEPASWIKMCGGADKAKEMLERIDTACKALGFDGVYPVATTIREHYNLDESGESLKNLHDAGFEGVYEYTFGTNDVELIKSVMEDELRMVSAPDSDCSNIDVIPTTSVGWNLIANFPEWNNPYTEYKTVLPADFDKLTGWVADFSSKMPADSLGKKLIMVDNWNEYTEGHSVMPGQWAGFSYLDTLEKYFTKNADTSKNNVKPTAKQLDRITNDFPQQWNGGHEWNFDAMYNEPEFWSKGEGIGRFITDGGGNLSFMIDAAASTKDADVYIQCCDGQQMDASAAKVMIRMKNGSELTGAKLYFTTDASPNFSEDKSVGFAIRPYDQYDSEYVLDLSGHAAWKGKINQIRIVFPTGGKAIKADVLVDYIRVGVKGPAATAKLGQSLGKQRVPLEYDFLEPLSYFENPVYIEESAGPKDKEDVFAKSPTIYLDGTLKNEAGEALAKYTVQLDTPQSAAVTDAKGYFQLKNVKAGYHTLYVYNRGGDMVGKTRFLLQSGKVSSYDGVNLTVAPDTKTTTLTLTVAGNQVHVDDVVTSDDPPPVIVPDDPTPGTETTGTEPADTEPSETEPAGTAPSTGGSTGPGTKPVSGPEEEGGNTLLIVLIVAVAVVAIAGGGTALYLVIRKRRAGTAS